MEEEAPQQAIEVPMDALAADVLQALLEEYASRDGTDYGEQERSLASKVAELRGLLLRGEARIVFDPESETATIVV